MFNKTIQKSTATKLNRYSSLFEDIKKFYPNNTVKILVYGCSTGEELVTLNNIFPDNEIFGVEIDENAIAKAKKMPLLQKFSTRSLMMNF